MKDIMEFMSTQDGQTAIAAMGAIGVASMMGAMAASSSSLVSLPNFLRAANFLGFRIFSGKRRKKWGTIYDSRTKMPIPLALVEVVDNFGRILDKSVTDKDGRYGFLAAAGEYRIQVTRNDFSFPSKEIVSKDPLYGNVYTGGTIKVDKDDVLKVDIPIDPVNIDLREVAQRKINFLYTVWGRIVMFIVDSAFYLGLALTVFNQIYFPSTLNLIFLSLYFALSLSEVFNRARKFGVLLDGLGKPIPFASIRIFEKKGEMLSRAGFVVTDMLGRYYRLVHNGEYSLQIDGKTVGDQNIDLDRRVIIDDHILNEKIKIAR